MAQFKIVGSRPTNDPNVVVFDVIYLVGALATGDEFVVYDTHHPINCKVIDITSIKEDPQEYAYPSPGTYRCSKCRFLGVCKAMDDGGDYQAILDSGFLRFS